MDWGLPCDAPGPLGSLQDLVELARSTGDPTHLRALAAALAHANQLEQAALLLSELVDARPDDQLARIDLATVQFECRRPHEAMRQLRAAADLRHRQFEITEFALSRMAQLQGWLDWADQYLRHQELRAAAMRERIAVGVATLDDRIRLARSLLSLTVRPEGAGTEITEAVAVLEAAHRLAPDHVQILELLFAAYHRVGNHAAGYAVERELERRAPHSGAVATPDDSVAALRAEHAARVNGLTQRAFQRDRAALIELRALQERMPSDRSLAGMLLIAEMVFGERNAVQRLTDDLAARPGLDHDAHFYLAQGYHFLGQRDLGEHHFNRAYALAANDSERQDVASLRARLDERLDEREG